MDNVIYEGMFWTEGNPDNKIPGLLDLAKQWPEAVLRGELVPLFSHAHGAMVVHGEVNEIGTVTLLESIIVQEIFASSGNKQTVIARYVLAGMNILAEPGDTYVGLRLELGGLESWVDIPSFVKIFDRRFARVEATAFEPESVELSDGRGRLSLFVSHGTRDSNSVSVRVWRTAALWISGIQPTNLEDLIEAYVEPLHTAISLCVDERLHVRAVYVEPADMRGRWQRVYGPRIWDDIEDIDSPRRPFLEFKDIGLANIARWLEVSRMMSPLGQIVISAMFSSADTSTALFQLASAIEGLHRRLYDDQERIDPKLAKVVRHAARKIFARFGPDVVRAVSDGLSFMAQPTYGNRLDRIILEMREINSDIFGARSDLWVRKVKASRNRVAHQLHAIDELPEREKMVLVQSLYWVAISLMMRQSGVSPETISAALLRNRRFGSFLAQAVAWMPDVYVEGEPPRDQGKDPRGQTG